MSGTAGRVRSLLLLVIFGALLGAGLAVPAAGAPVPLQSPDDPAAAATDAGEGLGTYDDLAGCVSGSGRLLVVLLIDESGSLQGTDPDAVRVAAAKTALTGLAGLTEASAGGARVDVLISAFSNTFKPVGTWRPLDATTLAGLQSTVDTLAERDTGMDTDFVNALTGARLALADEAVAASAAGGSGSPCKAILLFTDGRYDIGVRENPDQLEKYGDAKPYAEGLALTDEDSVLAVEERGRTALCGRDGVADAVRADEIVTLTVALAAKLRPEDQDFLEAVTSGTGGSQSCGERDGSRSGVFLAASDLESLIGTFDAVATRVAGGAPVGPAVPVTACEDDGCDEGSTTFAVDATLRRLHLFVTTPSAETQIELRADGSDPLVLSDRIAASGTVAGSEVTSAWPSDRAATIDITPTADAAGEWTVTLVDPDGGEGSVQVYAFTDLVATLAEAGRFEVGAEADLTANIVSRRDQSVVKDLRSAELAAVVTDPITGDSFSVEMEGTAGVYRGTVPVPADATTSVVQVVFELDAVTKGGVRITSTSPETTVAVRKPAAYPVLAPSELEFTSVSGEGIATADLILLPTGAGDEPGCFWLGEPNVVAAPQDVEPVGFSSTAVGGGPDSCLASPASGSLPVELELTPAARGSGTVRGFLRVWTAPADGAEPLPTDIPFSFEMARGIDTTKQLAVFAGLLFAGLLLPLVLLFLMNLRSTRFQSLRYVQGAYLPVVVRPKTQDVLRVSGDNRATQIYLGGSDFEALPSSGSPRRFTWSGLDFSARTSINPFAPGYATAAPSDGAAAVAKEGRRVNLDLSLAGSWMFLYDPDATDAASRRITGSMPMGAPPEIHGRLVAFVAQGPVGPQAERLLGDILTRLPRTAERLSELARDAQKG